MTTNMENNKEPKWWEFTIGFYPGVLFGIRTYNYQDSDLHVFYLPFIDFALEISK